MYEVAFVSYRNPNYDLDGNWNARSSRMHLWFPVINISPEQIMDFADDRYDDLIENLGRTLTKPSIELIIPDFLEVEPTHNYSPPVYASELSVETLEGGLAVVSGKYTGNVARTDLEGCGLMIEGIYADQMLERVEG